MALEVNYLKGWLDSDRGLNTTGPDFVAGQPATLTATGWRLAAGVSDVVSGIFKDDKGVTIENGPRAGNGVPESFQKASIVMGTNRVKMSAGLLLDGVTKRVPFAFPPATGTWAESDLLYPVNGFWDNLPLVTQGAPLGVVFKPPTTSGDTLEAIMFNTMGVAQSSAAIQTYTTASMTTSDTRPDPTTVPKGTAIWIDNEFAYHYSDGQFWRNAIGVLS